MQDDPNLNQNPTSNFTPNIGDDQPVQTPQQTSNQPISNPVREATPFHSEAPKAPENYMEVSEKEPQIAPEVEAAGVYKVSDKIKLDNAAKDAGITEAKAETPVTINGNKVVLPLTPAQAKIDAKGKPENSISWLAKIVMVYIQKLGGKNA